MTQQESHGYVSRGGDKLAVALDRFRVDVNGLVCADLGSHVGGFVDCLLRRGAAKVHSVDTCYGTLAWKLRRDARVVAYERANAMHVALPEPVDLVTIDVGWTSQEKILPNVAGMLDSSGRVVTLIKPHYQARKDLLEDGVLPGHLVETVVADVLDAIRCGGWNVSETVQSPIPGHGGNREVFALLHRDGSL